MLERVLLYGAVATALLPALPFAGRPLWVLAPAAIAAGALLILAAAMRFRGPRGPLERNDWLLASAGALWTVVVAHALWQAAPLGPAAALTSQGFDAAVSMNAGATVLGALRYVLYAAVLLLAYLACRSDGDGWRVLKAVAWTVGAAAGYAVLAKAFGAEYALWQEKRYYAGWATGPFTSRNSFAAYLAIGVAANVAVVHRAWRDAVPERMDGRELLRASALFIAGRGFFVLLPLLLVLGAAPLTGSRAGLAAVAFAAGLAWLLILLRTRRNGDGLAKAPLFMAAGLLLLAVVGAGVLQARGLSLSDSVDQRLEIAGDAARMAADAPLHGVGLGAFPEALHRYKSTTLVNDWRRAHNVYLESVAEHGWPAALLLFLAVGIAVFAAARGVWNRKRQAPIPVAAVAGFAAVALHSLVDFPLQEPGVCLTLALLLGAAAALAERPEPQPMSRAGRSGQSPSHFTAERRQI